MPEFSQPAAPSAFRTLGYSAAGLSFRAPTNWAVTQVKAPLVSVVSSGAAVVAVWRYRRSSPAPAGAAALRHARSVLIDAARARDASLQVIKAKAVTLDRAHGFELDAIERIDGQIRRVRSTHLFLAGAEVVLEEYAPTGSFHAVDHAVFSPLKRSLRLSAVGLG